MNTRTIFDLKNLQAVIFVSPVGARYDLEM